MTAELAVQPWLIYGLCAPARLSNTVSASNGLFTSSFYGPIHAPRPAFHVLIYREISLGPDHNYKKQFTRTNIAALHRA